MFKEIVLTEVETQMVIDALQAYKKELDVILKDDPATLVYGLRRVNNLITYIEAVEREA